LAYSLINPFDGKFYSQSGQNIIVKTYNGSYAAVANGVAATFTSATIATNIGDILHNFNPNFRKLLDNK
jgi:hypothetical protein